MAVATTSRGSLTITGAPRYNHTGVVITVYRNRLEQKIDPFPWQVCVLRVLKDSMQHLKKICFPSICTDDLSLAQFQSGEYFGAEVCAMDLRQDGDTDLILISAPMYKESDREGRVYICTLTDLVNYIFNQCYYIYL